MSLVPRWAFNNCWIFQDTGSAGGSAVFNHSRLLPTSPAAMLQGRSVAGFNDLTLQQANNC
eukprot:3098356-Lingulodinium_polyedra.AAC.1